MADSSGTNSPFRSDHSLDAEALSRLAANAAFFDGQAMRFRRLVELLPPRATARQAYAFLLIVRENAIGRPVTAKGLRQLAGRDGNADEILGSSIQRTYQLFMEKSEENPDGLGWVYTELDVNDRRQNFLRLTSVGLEVAMKIYALS